MFKQNLFKHLLSILAVASITSFASVGVSYAAASAMSMPIDTNDEAMVKLCKENGTVKNGMCQCSDEFPIWNAGKGCVAGNLDEAKTLCGSSGGEWNTDLVSCDCKKENTQFNSNGCVCKDGYKLEGAESLAEEKARCVVDENSGTGSTETPTGDDPVGAVTGIKIATKSFNDARFSYVRRDLDNTIATIRDVVSNAITNTNNIAALQSGKQTRPDDDHACAAGKTCLLVTDTSGTRNWYEIIDCIADNVLRGVNFDEENVSFGPGEPWGWKIASSSGNLMCRSSDGISCPDNTWVTSYDKNSSNVGDEIVFGTMQRVAIAEETRGSIVALPNSGLQSGDVCVCKATKYKLWNSGTSSYGPDYDINTDKWFVAGIATSDSQCFNKCADDRINGISKEAYYRNVANSCSADATVATQAVQCNAALHQHRDTASNTCVCDTGYYNNNGTCEWDCRDKDNSHASGESCVCDTNYVDNNGTCVWDCSGTAHSHASGTSCVCDTGYYNNNGTCEWDCRDKDNSHASGESCVCDDGYTEQNGSCVAQAPQQTCNSALETACNNSTNVGDWWNESTCTCDCASGRPGSVLGSNGQCVCPSGTEYNSTNGSCQAAPQCDVNTSLTEPGNIIENGEAWVSQTGTGPNGLWGGKACDGRVNGILNANNVGTYNADYSCHADEWVHAHDNVAVYGEAKMVAINNDTTGAIVSLPSGVQEVNAGGVCVCRVTALALTSGGSGFATTYSSRESINVGNTWMIAGRRESYGSDETGKQACITDCAFYTNSPNLITYYDKVGNSCSTTNVTNATACTPRTTTADPYVSFVSNAGSVIREDSLGISALSKEGKGTGLCATDTTSAFCQQATGSLNHWVLKYTINDAKKYITANSDSASNIYNGSWVMYGDSRCVMVSGNLEGLQEGVKQRLVLKGTQTTNDSRGTVCIRNIVGYAPWVEGKPVSITEINSGDYWYATRYKDATACQAACNGENLTATNMMTDVVGLTEAVNGMCGELK